MTSAQRRQTELTCACACSAPRNRPTRPPMFTLCCHGTPCQKLTGSACVLNAITEKEWPVEMLARRHKAKNG